MTSMNETRRLLLAAATAAALAGTGCAAVQPWERGTLADQCMIFDANGTVVGYMTHWQESREGSMGGFGVQGGGCGCK
jgi:Domain of unknown function (DUF4266)